MFHLLLSRCREFVCLSGEKQEVSMKQTGILGKNIFGIIGLKWCCVHKAAWSLVCVVLRFFPSGLTIKYASGENRNFKIFSKFHSFQFSSAILKNHGFNLLGWVFYCLAFAIGYIGLIQPVPKLTSGLSGQKNARWELQSRYFWTVISVFLNMSVYFQGESLMLHGLIFPKAFPVVSKALPAQCRRFVAL